MWKLPKEKEITPITRSEFRTNFLCELFILCSVIGLALFFYSLGLLSKSEASWLTLIVVLGTGIVFPTIQAQRLKALFPEQKISALAVGMYTFFPFLNVPLLYVCGFLDRAPRWVPALLKKRVAIPVFLFMAVQTSFFGFGIYPVEGIQLHAWLSNPSNQKIAYVASQAKIVFKIKHEHGGKDSLGSAFEEAQRIMPFDSTGKILSVAVIASDALKQKEILKKREPSSYNQKTSLLLLGNFFSVERASKDKGVWVEYSPLAILSPANLTEIALLSLVDNKIEESYRETLKAKLLEMTEKFEAHAKKDKDEEYLKKLAYYKAEIKNL